MRGAWRRIFRMFNLEKIAIFSAHGVPDSDRRHPSALESHDSTSVGTLRIPCDVVMLTFMAGDGHGIMNICKRFRLLGTRMRKLECGMRKICLSDIGSSFPHSAFRIPNSISSADCALRATGAYSPTSARRVHDPVDCRIGSLR